MSQEQKEGSLLQLPRRNKGELTNKFKRLGLTSNHYFVNYKQLKKIYIYSVKCTPMIPADNTQLRKKLLSEKHTEIKQQIENPIYSGMNIYSITAPFSTQKQYSCDQYTIKVKQVKVYDLQANPKLLLTFLNNGLRNMMNKLDFVEIGKSGKYFNGKEKTNIDNLIMYNGYKANFVRLQKGFFLRVDPAKKIVRNQTVLEFIDDTYKIHKDKDKQERRNIIKSQLVGKTVMSNYGKTQYYQINDVQFKQLSEIMIEEKMSLLEYYAQKYKITLKNTKQPLLVSASRRKEDKIYLIPELMLMTGIPENFDQFRRKKISEQTIKDPDAKLRQIQGLMNKIADSTQMRVMEEIGIGVSSKLQKVQGKQIPVPQLQLGKNNYVDNGKEAFFSLFNKPIYSAKHDVSCKIIHSSNTDIREMKEVFQRTSKNLGVDIKLQSVEINPSIANIQREVARAIQKDFKICCIIIPVNMKSQYKDIKIFTLKSQLVTQIVTEATMRKKGLQSIATKALLQIIAKRGNILWVPRISAKIAEIQFAGMLIAFDQSKLGNRTLLSVCATISSTFSLIYTCTKIFQGNENKFKTMTTLLCSAIKAFNKRNKGVPEQVIIFQNSCPTDQITLLQELFVDAAMKSLAQVYPKKIALTLVMINVKTNERFFAVNGKVHNPPAGTLVCDQIVSQNYDFYIVSQQSNKGTVVPNHYKVVYSDSKMEQGLLHNICFSQCFNYVNWTGSIKVPGIMQYAKKAAKFGAEVLGDMEVPEQLHTKLYYV